MRPELDDTHAAPPSDPAKTATLAGGARAADTPGDLVAGVRLDHFRIDSRLGAGGMGEVYLATDLALDRPVAIKVLASGIARDRLVREARAQARIQHPNVGHIYFIGEDTGRLYFAMEYIAGRTLAQRLADGPLPVEEALDVIRAAALGLREAQRAGITHRDVKPSNLMVDGNGHVKVVDFGLAAGTPTAATDGPPRVTDRTASAPRAEAVQQTTMAGTPLYMAPEQARGEPVDCRADIYGLGATLYHLVSGKPPFEAETVEQLVSMHATAARPALPRSKANPRTQIAAIEPLIAKMMAPRAEDRFGSYDELIQAIEVTSAQRTRPAGFWVRCVASMIDMLLAMAALALVQAPFSANGVHIGDYGFLLAMLYGVLALGRWGSTAGKALFELEVVDHRTGGRASWRQVIIREGVLIGSVLVYGVAERGIKMLEPPYWLVRSIEFVGMLYMLSLVAMLLHAALRSPGKRAPWDRIAGTMVRYKTARR